MLNGPVRTIGPRFGPKTGPRTDFNRTNIGPDQDPEQYANMLDLSLFNAYKKFLPMWDFYLLNQSFNFKLVRFVNA